MKEAPKQRTIKEPLFNLNATIMHLRMDIATHDKLRNAAEKQNTTQSKLIRHLIIENC
jgi:hypothetical protein